MQSPAEGSDTSEIYYQENAISLPNPIYNSAPRPVIKLSLFLSLPVCRRFTNERGGEGVDEEPNNTTARKPGPL
jgi:hypothetical protein